MSERKPLSKRTRFEVLKRDRFTCQYCGKAAPDAILHVDHIVPVSKGGTDEIENLVTACESCNLGKSNIELSDDAVIKARKRQLDELAARREQLEMMYKWQLELVNNTAVEVDTISRLCAELTGSGLSMVGEENIKALINKFGYETVIDAVRVAFTHYPSSNDSEWEFAFGKIGGICYNRTHKTCSQCIHDVGYDERNHLVECEFDHDGSKWCKNSYAEVCNYYASKWDGGECYA